MPGTEAQPPTQGTDQLVMPVGGTLDFEKIANV
jgi:hypothetical protein